MTGALIILAVVVIVGAILYIHHRVTDKDEVAIEEVREPQLQDEQCCGMHIVCEKDSLLTAVRPEIIYYDDEELDVYKGRKADEYDSAEIDQFREVLLTLLPQDIAGWGRSIQLRGIELPIEVRDELLMIVAEARQKQA